MRSMRKSQREKELHVLKVIAETLNYSNDLQEMLQSVLSSLLQVTGLSTGWIFLVNEKPEYDFVASKNLPEALTADKRRMCKGVCHCLAEYWNDNLIKPVNIIECKRLNDAKKYEWGSTNGITHHATVPIAAGNEQLGILNVASPNKQLFSNEELNLLQLVSYQIGTAIKRVQLYHEQKNRADNLTKLHKVIQLIWSKQSITSLLKRVTRLCQKTFHWHYVVFYIKDGNYLNPYVLKEKTSENKIKKIPLSQTNEVTKSFHQQEMITTKKLKIPVHSNTDNRDNMAIICPLLIVDSVPIGVMVVIDNKKQESRYNDQLVRSLSEHVSLAIQQIRMKEQHEQIVVYEERNRLARDLHDSVNQKLFSLTMMSRGVQEIYKKKKNVEIEKNLLQNIQKLSKEALTEMKELIWQLRPAGIEEGLVTALKKYGKSLGLEVVSYVQGVNPIPRMIEETLWRIGQEAINNVKKHADVKVVTVKLYTSRDHVQLLISDFGEGFNYSEQYNALGKLGLVMMKERVETINGSIQITSEIKKGTEINVFVPLKE